MILDDTRVAVNDALMQCHKTAHHLARFADSASDDNFRSLLVDIADTHFAAADRLSTAVRELNILPQEPDPEREVLERMVSRARALAPGDTPADEAVEAERKLLELLEIAASHDLPAEVADGVEFARTTANVAIERLRKY